MIWRSDIHQAPKGEHVEETFERNGKTVTRHVHKPAKVILATKCGKVVSSKWLAEHGRWEFLAAGEAPIAWQPWPEHPGEAA